MRRAIRVLASQSSMSRLLKCFTASAGSSLFKHIVNVKVLAGLSSCRRLWTPTTAAVADPGPPCRTDPCDTFGRRGGGLPPSDGGIQELYPAENLERPWPSTFRSRSESDVAELELPPLTRTGRIGPLEKPFEVRSLQSSALQPLRLLVCENCLPFPLQGYATEPCHQWVFPLIPLHHDL